MYAELSRMIANLIKQGVVAEVNASAGLVRVRHGELLTDWLGYFVPAAGGVVGASAAVGRGKLHCAIAERRAC